MSSACVGVILFCAVSRLTESAAFLRICRLRRFCGLFLSSSGFCVLISTSISRPFCDQALHRGIADVPACLARAASSSRL